MRLNNTLLSALGAAGLALGLASAPANAAVCGPFQADPAISCAGIPGDANDSAADVNTLYPRDPDKWALIDKDDTLGGAPAPTSPWLENDFFLTDANGGAFVPGTTNSGFFFISDSILLQKDELILVLKGGSGDPRWAAFLLDLPKLTLAGGYGSGTWSSRQGLSHASLYGIGDGDDQTVPEPGSLALLGLGLAGLGMARRRKAA